MNQTQTNRIEVVDALRGLALCVICITFPRALPSG